MDFALTDEQRMLVETVRSFIQSELKPLEDEVEATGMLRPELAAAIHAKAKALGLYAIISPRPSAVAACRRSITCCARSSSATRPIF